MMAEYVNIIKHYPDRKVNIGALCVIPANAGISGKNRDSGTTAGMTCRNMKRTRKEPDTK